MSRLVGTGLTSVRLRRLAPECPSGHTARKNVWTFSLRSEPGRDVYSVHPRSSAVLCPDIPLDQKKAVISAIYRASAILCLKGMRADILPMPPAIVLFVEPTFI